jgi:hypothetical protein
MTKTGPMPAIKAPKPVTKQDASPLRASITLAELKHRLGAKAAEELFVRIDKEQLKGLMILGRNIREARAKFGKVQKEKNVQVVVRGNVGKHRYASSRTSEASSRTSEGLVILRIDDLEAVVKAAQQDFNWAKAFAPRSDLPAATEVPEIKRGSRGRRTLSSS